MYIFKEFLRLQYSFDAYIPIITLILLLGVIAIVTFKGKIPLAVIFYGLIFHLSILSYIISGGVIGEGYYEGYFIYFLQPFIIWLSVSQGIVKSEKILIFISKTTLISVAGSVFYYINLFFPFESYEELFSIELTTIGSKVVIRNTSIYGNSLVAAGIGLVQLCCAAMIVTEKRKSSIFMMFLAFIFIGATLSRRSMVTGCLLFFILYLISPKSIKNNIIAIVGISSILVFAFFWEYVFIFFDRLISSIDFSSKNLSNSSRINAMWMGLVVLFSNPLGVGFGSLSSLGKTVKNLDSSETFINVTESMYTTYAGEVGLVFIIPIFLLFYLSISKKNKIIKFLFIYIFIIESIMGLSLLNPAVNFMFFLVYFSYNQDYFFKKNVIIKL